jgi:hypothetical protein
VSRERGPLPLSEALLTARQLAEALDSAAERLVEHGALHPRDVLLSSEGTRIVGLGITRALERIGAAVPIRRPYTAPERVDGAAWDHRADIFSLAAVVHEMLWGRRVVGTGMQAVEAMTPLPGTHLMPLQAVFARALAEQAVDRFATATEFVESLERAVSADDTPAEPRRLEVLEPPRRVEPVEAPMLPLEDDIAPIEPQWEEPVLQLHEPESIPPAELEPLSPREPLELLEPLAPVEPREPQPLFLASTPAFSPSSSSGSSSLVWPIGLACLVGLAIGFGVGYTVGVRDRVSVSQTTGERPAAAAPRDFTEGAVAAPPTAETKPRTDPRLPQEGAPVVPFNGRVAVQSTPAGARVFVDGRDRGTTPATVSDLERGEHRVRIIRDGYTTSERRIVLSPARPSLALAIPLAKVPEIERRPERTAPSTQARPVVPKPPADASHASPKTAAATVEDAGTLLVESRPAGATVFVDGRAVGKTPLTLSSLKVGDHAVRLDLAEHRLWTTSIKIVGGAPNRIGASLEKID